MDDLERYGDYNDTEEDDVPSGKKSPIALILKILIGAVCVFVVGFMACRISFFNYYPDSIKNIYFNDVLLDYYESRNGDIGALTQIMRASYDDPDEGNFFCDNLIVIPGADQVQVSVRFNTSVAETLEKTYKTKVDINDPTRFTFILSRNPSGDEKNPVEVATATVVATESKMMYRYFKLVFDGVDLGLDEGEEAVKWLRVEVHVEGIEKPFMIAIYENHEDYNTFAEYKISKKELPGK